MDKSPEAFRTISEVAEDLDLPQHVLRFWETRFAQIKPLKRGGGRRYYRPDDIDLLRGIRRLLYGEGYTIKGVQRILRDQGLRHVAMLGRAVVAEAEPAGREPAEPRLPEPPAAAGPEFYAPPAERALAGAPPFALREDQSVRDYAPPSVRAAVVPEPLDEDEDEALDLAAEQEEPEPVAAPVVEPPPREDDPEPVREAPPVVAAPTPVVPQMLAPLPMPEPAAPRPAPVMPTRSPLPRRDPEITAEGLRRLRATLFELTECKRLLDEARQI